jgi:hypothetical protein
MELDVYALGGDAIAGALELDGMDDVVITGPVLNPADGPFSVLAWDPRWCLGTSCHISTRRRKLAKHGFVRRLFDDRSQRSGPVRRFLAVRDNHY